MPHSAEATFVYDGDCAFCTACARFVERHIPGPARVAPWQWTDLGALGLTVAQCDEAVQWVDPDGTAVAGPDAIARLLGSSTVLWRVPGRVLRLRPVRRLAWPAYRWIARNRHRLPGGTAACSLPHDQRDRAHPRPGGPPTAG